MITSLRTFLTSNITVETLLSKDAFGKPTFGNAITVSARVANKPMMVRSLDGLETVSRVTAWVESPLLPIGPTDRITLPDGTTPKILSVQRVPDETGQVFTTVFFA